MKALKLFALSGMVLFHAEAELLPGAELQEWPADSTRHVVKIERVVAKPDDAKWIAAAENVPADAVAMRVAAQKEQPDAVVGEKQWWYKQAVNVKIPYALTADAVTYYQELVTGFGKQAMKRYSNPGSRFSYSATVSQHATYTLDQKTYQHVTVVTMRMEFSESFAATVTEAMDFSKQRVVVFDQEGKVLHVSGDGATEVPIMAI